MWPALAKVGICCIFGEKYQYLIYYLSPPVPVIARAYHKGVGSGRRKYSGVHRPTIWHLAVCNPSNVNIQSWVAGMLNERDCHETSSNSTYHQSKELKSCDYISLDAIIAGPLEPRECPRSKRVIFPNGRASLTTDTVKNGDMNINSQAYWTQLSF